MNELQVTNTFVKKLTKNIRTKYGKEPSHVEVMELVADALGWQAGPLMHALKTAAANGSLRDANSVPQPEPVFDTMTGHPITQWVEAAHHLFKLRLFQLHDLERITDLIRQPSGLLVVASETKLPAIRIALSVAKDWEARIGAKMVFRAHPKSHMTIPYGPEFGLPAATFNHLAISQKSAPRDVERSRFSMVSIAGSPLNMMNALITSGEMPTIATVCAGMLRLIAGATPEAGRFWSKENEPKSRQEFLISELHNRNTTIISLNDTGDHIRSVKVSSFAEWMKDELSEGRE